MKRAKTVVPTENEYIFIRINNTFISEQLSSFQIFENYVKDCAINITGTIIGTVNAKKLIEKCFTKLILKACCIFLMNRHHINAFRIVNCNTTKAIGTSTIMIKILLNFKKQSW